MAQRYYFHGDLKENTEDHYYCGLCDHFEQKEHFDQADHFTRNKEKFDASRTAFKKANSRFLQNYSRPKDATNLFSHLRLSKPRKSVFYRWLIEQKERKDLIGDLANDVSQDSGFPIGESSIRKIKNYLIFKRACEEALDEAFSEFNNYKKNEAR